MVRKVKEVVDGYLCDILRDFYSWLDSIEQNTPIFILFFFLVANGSQLFSPHCRVRQECRIEELPFRAAFRKNQ